MQSSALVATASTMRSASSTCSANEVRCGALSAPYHPLHQALLSPPKFDPLAGSQFEAMLKLTRGDSKYDAPRLSSPYS